jgi:hypothetical protein
MQKQNQTNTKNVERHATGARGTDLPPLFFRTFCLQIYFQ